MTGLSRPNLPDIYLPVFGADTDRILAEDPALAAYASLTALHVGGLLMALREYAKCWRLLEPVLRSSALCDGEGQERRREALFDACVVTRVHQTTAPMPKRDARWRLGVAGERLVFGVDAQKRPLPPRIMGLHDTSLGELCHLLSVLDCYARGAAPISMTGLPAVEGLLMGALAHNALIAVRQTPILAQHVFAWRHQVLITCAHAATGSNPADDPPTVPDYLEPLAGWRMWYVRSDCNQLRLTSVNGAAVWQPYKATVAMHGGESHPNLCHVCGIYAFRSLTELRRAMVTYFGNAGAMPWVAGQVWLWGKFVEHQRGWRAQFAYPAKFIFGHQCDARALAAAYGIAYEAYTFAYEPHTCADEEVFSWTSARKSEPGLRNHYDPRFPSHRRLLPSAPPRSQRVSQPLNPSRPATSPDPRLYATLSFTTEHRTSVPHFVWRDAVTLLSRVVQRLHLGRRRFVR